MAIDNENFNTKLYDLLKVRGYKPVPLNAKNQRVEASPAADVIEFTFKKDGEEYGKAWVSVDDAQKLVVYYDNEQADSPSGATPGLDYDDTWTGLLKQLKNWAQRRQLSFQLSDADRISDDMRHREYNKMKDKLSEGYYPMGKSASYNDAVPSVKIILQHTRQIQEGEQRFRNIAKIFLENEQGERILAPTMRPGIARVYARHIAEGGLPNDERWNHIKGLCEEYNKMAGFVRATRNGQFNESAQQLVNEGINHYNKLRESLSKMTGHRGYTAYFESYTPTLLETEGDEQSNLNELFVQETLDPRIESVMPILSRLRKNIGEMKEVSELSEWASNLMGEATDLKTIPEEEEVEEGMVGKILGGAALIASLWGVNYELAKDSFDHSPQLQKLEQYYQRAQKEGNLEKIKEIARRIDLQKDRLMLDKGEVMGKDGRPIDPVYEAEDDVHAKFDELLRKNPKLAQKVKTLEPEQRQALMNKLKDAEDIAKQKGDDFSGHDMENYGRAFKGILGGLFGTMEEEKEEGMEENFINMVPQAVAEVLDTPEKKAAYQAKAKASVPALNQQYSDAREKAGRDWAPGGEEGLRKHGDQEQLRKADAIKNKILKRRDLPEPQGVAENIGGVGAFAALQHAKNLNKQPQPTAPTKKQSYTPRHDDHEETMGSDDNYDDEMVEAVNPALANLTPDEIKGIGMMIQNGHDIPTIIRIFDNKPTAEQITAIATTNMQQGVAEGSLNEFAIDKEPNGDNRSKLIGTIVQLLKSGKKVDFYVPGIRGHVVGSGGNGDWLTLKRWNKPYSKINYSLELDASDDSRFSLKMIKPDYYQVVQSEDMNQGVAEGLDANQKRAGQLGPTEKVKNNNIGKLVGANENFINTVDQAVVSEDEDRPYVCVHAKKGKCEVKASSSYQAAQKAAQKWGLKGTAGIDAYLADVTHDASSLEESTDELARILQIMNHKR
jgi:hypothetical protein